ncbi:hypothetical protein [Leptolyngbya sp. FACHB-261]|uniref:GumC family protein n=1 Tax=Leptolyngbya sp. FACHB-261 TaxID=2692806 RepID=UPI001687CE02|nr:hypothetical protein [Leptolyngbya sp. FACHB-261]MBD2103247.1 hypothetical protein [Leptolyngbya sp. FACHB-261]
MNISSSAIPVSPPKALLSLPRASRYLIAIVGANVLIWGLTLAYLKLAPKAYTSDWSLILPGAGANSSVNIGGIGQASYSADSAYAGGSVLDPKANYKAIAASDEVRELAAKSLKIEPRDLDKPRIELVDSTSVIEFSVTGDSPEEAQRKSLAYYEALNARLNELRSDEAEQREIGVQRAIGEAAKKLEGEQQRLSAYKAKSGLVSADQVENLLQGIEELRKQWIALVAQQQQSSSRLARLSQDLGLTPQQASEAFLLQSDRQFQQNLKDYAETSAALTVLRSKWGTEYPGVLIAEDKQEATREALLKRGRTLLGRPVDEVTLQRLGLPGEVEGRETLYKDLIASQADQKGITSQVNELAKQISRQEEKLSELVRQEPGLEDLQRNLKVSEAVFTSTLAQLDLGKSDLYASYPLVQLLEKPSLSRSPSSPNPLLAFMGSGFASALITGGLILLWLRGGGGGAQPPSEVSPEVPHKILYLPENSAETVSLNGTSPVLSGQGTANEADKTKDP